jgi:hypothetical protein
MNRQLTALCLGVCIAAAPALAQQFWEKKEFTRWSRGECKTLLSDSPWVKKTRVSKDLLAGMDQLTAYPSNAMKHDESADRYLTLEYTVQLRSALPVRQAVVRQAQHEGGYDRMSPEEKKAFDREAERYLSSAAGGDLIVHVEYRTNSQSVDRDVRNFWQSIPKGSIPEGAALILPDGQRVAPTRYVSSPQGDRSFELIFPREVNGRPLISAADKSLKVEFQSPGNRELRCGTMQVEFSVQQLVFKGELAY